MASRMINFDKCKHLANLEKSVCPTIVGCNILYKLIRLSVYMYIRYFCEFFLLVLSVSERGILNLLPLFQSTCFSLIWSSFIHIFEVML